MKKKLPFPILALIVAVLVVILILLITSPYSRKIDVTLDGYSSDWGGPSKTHPAQITIKGTATYRFFSIKGFTGTMKLDDPEFPFDKHVTFTFDSKGRTASITSFEPGGVNFLETLEHAGYVFMRDFDEVLVTFSSSRDESSDDSRRHSSSFFVAPAYDPAQMAEIAEKLTENTMYEDARWDWD
ncbi:MAG: hypothetical protein IJA35_06840 [Clostridia bacterium]|nr:hypothetical protein [Clostridia bacterium]